MAIGDNIQVQVTRGILCNSSGVYDVTAFGALSDGSADSVAFEQAAFNACEAGGGGTVYYPQGTYKRVSSHVTIPHGVEITILGDNAWLDGESNADHAFVFDNGGGALYPTFPLVEFDGIGFKNFTVRAIEASTYDTGGRSTITRLEMRNCKFDACEFGMFIYTKLGSALIECNTFENFSSDDVGCLFIGSKYEVDVPYTGNIIVKDNYASSIVSTHATAHHHAFIAFGHTVVFQNNIITDNTASAAATDPGAGPSAIGIKAYDVVISGNILTNAGGSNDGHIYVKGLARGVPGSGSNGGASYNVLISDNVVISTETETWNSTETGICVDGEVDGRDNVHVSHNYIEGLRANGIQLESSSSSSALLDNMTVSSNTINDMRGDNAIYVYGSGNNIIINDNLITDFQAIGINVNAFFDLTNLVIAGNTISDNGIAAPGGGRYGIFCKQTGGDLTDATIRNNNILFSGSGTQQGITVYETSGTITHGVAADNHISLTAALGNEYAISSTAAMYYDTDIGTPNSKVCAPVGKLYMDLNGGTGTTLYIKESGAWTNTGWVAK